MAGVFALTLLTIFDWQVGSARFRNPHILTEPTAWFLHLVMLIIFVILVGAVAASIAGPRARTRWQIGALVAAIVAVVAAGAVGWAARGSVWGFPLADLVWWFDVIVIVEQIVALFLAIALGTPGCEVGVWAELIARARGTAAPTEEGLACVVGLHLLDAWEARRRAAAAQR